MSTLKDELCADLERRVSDRILEPTNAELLKKLIVNAESDNEAMMIAELGTTYKHTGLHFDKRLEKMTSEISYFSKNDKLSFHTDDDKPINKLIIGDNYEALQNLLIQYKNHVDVIYIDPPYGKDSMGEFAKTNYENAITRDNLLSMLYPRLILAQLLLSENGVIFCSIDDKNQAYVKCLFDEVFGENNFLSNLIWKKKQGGGNDSSHIIIEHEYILCYAKNNRTVHLGVDSQYELDAKLYPFKDTFGEYGLITLDKASIQISKSLIYEIKDKEGNTYFPRIVNGKQSCWRWSKKKVEEQFDELVFKNGKVYTKYYKPTGITPKSLLTDSIYGRTESGNDDIKAVFPNTPFKYPKPVALLKHLLSISSEQDSIILDFFAGSGTTGHAVLDLNAKDGSNRTFILCQLNEKTDTTPNGIAYDVTAKRLKRIMTGECYDGNKDFEWVKKNKPYGGNLDVYEIASVANFEATEGKTPFDVIDETLYGEEKFQSMHEKIDWVCQNFSQTQKRL